jgi:hypothetical protein
MKPLLLAALCALSATAASATETDLAAAAQAASQMAAFNPADCSVAKVIRAHVPHGGVCSTRGDYGALELGDAVKAVFGEASMVADEQCAVALTIFNRARNDRTTLSRQVRMPGQFEGYYPADRRECDKLKASARAVMQLAYGGTCSFGERNYRFFCSAEGWENVKGNHVGDWDQGTQHGESVFRYKSECGRRSPAQ